MTFQLIIKKNGENKIISTSKTIIKRIRTGQVKTSLQPEQDNPTISYLRSFVPFDLKQMVLEN